MIRSWLERLRASRLWSGISTLVAGAVLARGLTILVSPILTRLFTPEEFGVLAVYVSVISVAVTFASLRYELAIPLPEAPRVGSALLALSLCLLVVTTACIAILAGVWGSHWLPDVGAGALVGIWWTVPLGVGAAGLYNILSYWGVRVQDYRRLARTKISQGVGGAVGQVSLGVIGLGPLALVLGDIVGRSSGAVSLGLLARSESHGARWPGWSAVREAASRYREFPVFSVPASVLNSIGLYSPALVLAALYGPAEAGLFALAQRVAGIGVALVGHAIGQAYMGEAAQLAREDRKALGGLFWSIARKLFGVGVAGFVPLALIAPILFSTVFGSEWEFAGDLVRVLAPFYVMQLVVSPLSQTLNLLERQRLNLAWEVARLALGPALLLWAGLAGRSVAMALGAYGAGMALAYAVLLVLCHVSINRHAR